jgi:GTPase SAR1 family protein
MFEVEEPNYKIKPPKMSCDYQLSLKYPIKDPFPNKSFSMIIAGKPGSGKTSFLMSMLNNKGENRIYRKVFKNIIVVSPSLNSLPDGLLNGIPQEQLYEELNDDVLDMITENNEKYKEKPDKHYSQLLILDDIASWLKLKKNVVFLNKIFFNRRHLRLSIILTTQYIYQVPKSVRANASDIVLFQPTTSEYETIRKEFVPMSKPKFIEFMKYVFRDPHDTLYINDKREYFRNLGKVIDKDDIMLNREVEKEEKEKKEEEEKK